MIWWVAQFIEDLAGMASSAGLTVVNRTGRPKRKAIWGCGRALIIFEPCVEEVK